MSTASRAVRALNDASRQYYLEFVNRTATTNGIKTFYWDNGAQSGASDVFALFDRNSGAIVDANGLNAIMRGVGGTQHHVCAGGDEERHRHRHRDLVTVGHQLRLDLQRQLQQRNLGHADRRGGQRIDVRRLERRVQRHGNSCTVSMTAARNVTATFNSSTASFTLSVTKAGSGTGTVTSNAGGHQLRQHLQRQLRQRHLGHADRGGRQRRELRGLERRMLGHQHLHGVDDAARAVTATFNTASTFALGVTRAGTGTGTVTSNPSGINCGTSCTANYASGTSVTLTAAAASGSTFAGWSGSCTGTGSCVLSMTAARNVTATFNTSGGGTGGTCANPVTFTNQSGNFNTTGAVCYRTNQNIAGWGCSNFDGRTLTVGGVARTCGQLPLTRAADGYYYFAVTAGSFAWASLYAW